MQLCRSWYCAGQGIPDSVVPSTLSRLPEPWSGVTIRSRHPLPADPRHSLTPFVNVRPGGEAAGCWIALDCPGLPWIALDCYCSRSRARPVTTPGRPHGTSPVQMRTSPVQMTSSPVQMPGVDWLVRIDPPVAPDHVPMRPPLESFRRRSQVAWVPSSPRR